MRVALAALRALPVTFTIYVIEALFALTLAVPLGAELHGDGRALGARTLFRAAALERALELLPALRVQGRSLALSAVLLLALTPLLHMAWLSALSAPLGIQRALSEGTRLYLRACVASLWVAVLGALALCPWALFAYLVDSFVDAASHARLHDLLLVGTLASALPVLFLVHVAHDLAHAFALKHAGLSAARMGLRTALSARTLLVALALSLLGLALGLAPLLLDAGTSQPGELISIALLQATCFATLGLRSLWLAYALTCTERDATSRVLGD